MLTPNGVLRFHGDEDLGGAAGLAERRALVQRLAVVLDQHVLVIAANTHTHANQTNPPMMGRHTHSHSHRNASACVHTRAHTHAHTHTEENGEKRKSARE